MCCMKNKILCFCLVIFAVTFANAQSDKKEKKEKKGTFYVAFGTQRIWYTNSDIHVRRSSPSPAFDFTLFNVKARDEGGFKWNTAPQFSYTIGYYFKKKNFGLEYH